MGTHKSDDAGGEGCSKPLPDWSRSATDFPGSFCAALLSFLAGVSSPPALGV
jgi:hypothetical protein